VGIAKEMSELLEATVVFKGVRIGRIVDVILDRAGGEVVGFEVRCEDRRDRFLPRAAVTIADDSTVEIGSPFALLDAGELEFYRERGVTLRRREEPAA
jgi:sporulation protein YlmC with PRC-barrel domain